ncbi:endolytic transglycosylase MltG [Candidatus Peregrinibacteria bacterium]|nr:endolytic transglycosylase MltG [Candidatus Peregrinibacteria bacterium]
MPKRQKSSYSGKFIAIIFIILLLSYGYLKYKDLIYNPIDEDASENISFQIKKGQSVKEIAVNLEEKELIKSDTAFYFYASRNDLGQNILAGRFILNQSMNVPEIIAALSDPSLSETIITIQEGLNIKEIDEKLASMDIIASGEFISAVNSFNGWKYYGFLEKNEQKKLKYQLEGYIYPDTYFFDPATFEAQDLIYLALDNFEQKIEDILPQINDRSLTDIIIMASIVENEVFGKVDRQKVAGILWKRLDNGWTLGADATLLYITDDRHIGSNDLNLDSPYNTRKNGELPPGPIGNPSIEAIQAALNPIETEYWFYLNKPDTGETIYAVSNEEHNQNKAKYL